MLYLIKWLYAWFMPLGFVVAAFVVASARLIKNQEKGHSAIALLTFFLYLSSLEPIGNMLISSLEDRYIQSAVPLQAEAIVVLGGGSYGGVADLNGSGQVGDIAANRLLTALRLQRQMQVPIVLSGGVVFAEDGNESAIEKRVLIEAGVPETMIYTEDNSRNTAENAAYTMQLCREHGWKSIILLTSAFHMPRAMGFFSQKETVVRPYPCDYQASRPLTITPFSLIPNAQGLYNTTLAVKEYAGMGAHYLGFQ